MFDKICREIETKILSLISFLHNRAVYETEWKNIVELDRPQTTLWRIRITCWIPKAKDTQSEYVIYYLSIVAIVARTRLNITLRLHCVSGLYRYQIEKSVNYLAPEFHI
jgi:hypothetical protein